MKKVVSVLMLVVMALSMIGCSVSKEEVIGTWSGSWVYNGNSYSSAFVLAEDNTYASATYKNGSFYETEVGTYEIDGGSVDLHPDGNTGITRSYDFKGGKLYNGDHEFTKE